MVRMAKALVENGAYRIYYHKKPDGDAIGSSYALALGLRSLGVKCALYCSDPISQAYRYLMDGIPSDEVPEDCPGIAVDSPAPSRLGRYEGAKIDFCIDHHENNRFSGALQYTGSLAAADTRTTPGASWRARRRRFWTGSKGRTDCTWKRRSAKPG